MAWGHATTPSLIPNRQLLVEDEPPEPIDSIYDGLVCGSEAYSFHSSGLGKSESEMPTAIKNKITPITEKSRRSILRSPTIKMTRAVNAEGHTVAPNLTKLKKYIAARTNCLMITGPRPDNVAIVMLILLLQLSTSRS